MIAEINKQLEKHNNVLLYNEDLHKYYKKRDNNITTIYISTPKKGKTAFESMLKKLDHEATVKGKTISKLIEEIQEKTADNELRIYVDSFEQLGKRELPYYKELEEDGNIHLVANICEDKEFIDGEFLKKFVILNEEYYNNRSQSINVTYPLLLVLSLLVFFLFLRLQLSITNYLVNTLWFTLLMYRTIYYITR
ncbi:MAG: hypothetical protein BZ137_07570 [Methanosphaera sp. rholeuAM130]|nr:MAG: hypothetical protein BZ137_07570 [Methanosphaera sp. rholeuAM130]